MADTGVPVAPSPLRFAGEAERADHREQLLEGDADFEAGQVGPEAEVDAVTEREMGIGIALPGGTAPGPRSGTHRGWPTPPTPPPSGPAAIVCPRSSVRSVAVRRFEGDGVVHLRTSSTAVSSGTERLRRSSSWSGHSVKASTAPAMALRVVSAPGREDQGEEGGELVLAQPRRVRIRELGVDDDRQHVGAGVGPLLGDQRCSVLAHPRQCLLSLRAHGQEVGLVGEVEDVLDRFEEEVPVFLGHAEQEADRLHRELGRHVDQEVALVARRLERAVASVGAAPG